VYIRGGRSTRDAPCQIAIRSARCGANHGSFFPTNVKPLQLFTLRKSPPPREPRERLLFARWCWSTCSAVGDFGGGSKHKAALLSFPLWAPHTHLNDVCDTKLFMQRKKTWNRCETMWEINTFVCCFFTLHKYALYRRLLVVRNLFFTFFLSIYLARKHREQLNIF